MMRRLLLSGAILIATVTAHGQEPAGPAPAITSYDDYSVAMKTIAAQNTALRKSLGSAADADSVAAAAKLEAAFKDVLAYWPARHVDDAATMARTAVSASQAIAKAVAAHDTEGASAASQALAGTCGQCHTAHRERVTFDFYRIK